MAKDDTPTIKIGSHLAHQLFNDTQDGSAIVSPECHGVLHERGVGLPDIMAEASQVGETKQLSGFIKITDQNYEKLNDVLGIDLTFDPNNPNELMDQLKESPAYLVQEGVSPDGSGIYKVLENRGTESSLLKKNFLYTDLSGESSKIKKAVEERADEFKRFAERDGLETILDGWGVMGRGVKNKLSDMFQSSKEPNQDGETALDYVTEPLSKKSSDNISEATLHSDLQKESMKNASLNIDAMAAILDDKETESGIELLTLDDELHRERYSEASRKRAIGEPLTNEEAFSHHMEEVHRNLSSAEHSRRNKEDSLLAAGNVSIHDKTMDTIKNNDKVSAEIGEKMSSKISDHDKLSRMEELRKTISELIKKLMEFINKIFGVGKENDDKLREEQKKQQDLTHAPSHLEPAHPKPAP